MHSRVRAVLIASTCLMAMGAPRAQAPVERARYLMGTVCEGAVFPSPGISAEEAAAALEAAFDEIARIEVFLSDYRQDSELSRLNREAGTRPFRLSSELMGFVKAAIDYSRETEGAFDITVAPLVSLWDLRGEGRTPSESEIGRALERTGYSRVIIDPEASTLSFSAPGMGLDPGALGKGYALDAAARVLRGRGQTSAMLDFGGQILAIGAPPGIEAWEIDVAHPLDRSRPARSLKLRDRSVSTSGNSEKGPIVSGRPLGHVVDPRTGRLSETLGSATVIAATAEEADALSTALLVMGPDAGLDWAAGRPGVEVLYLEAARGDRLVERSTPGFGSMEKRVSSGEIR